MLLCVDKDVENYDEVVSWYRQRTTGENSGFDLYVVADCDGSVINHHVSMMDVEGRGFWMVPRSSISNTALRMKNSVGLIDPNYRGCLIAKCDNTWNVAKKDRLFQVVRWDMKPFAVTVVDELPATARGDGGFGSTGK